VWNDWLRPGAVVGDLAAGQIVAEVVTEPAIIQVVLDAVTLTVLAERTVGGPRRLLA
jgi:hypothetical protein